MLLPALRNPVVLAHGIATLDQISEGRFILGVGIASDVPNIRAEFVACGVPFEKRVGRMLEGLRLCRELWSGRPVSWNGRWVMENVTLGARCRTARADRRSGSAAWCAPAWSGSAGFTTAGSRTRPTPEHWRAQWAEIGEIARAAGRDPGQLTGAVYLTLTIDDDKARAEERMNAFIAELLRPARLPRCGRGRRPMPARRKAPPNGCRPGHGPGRVIWCCVLPASTERHLEAISRLRAKSPRKPGNGADLTLVNPSKPRGASPHFGARPGGTRRSPARLLLCAQPRRPAV